MTAPFTPSAALTVTVHVCHASCGRVTLQAAQARPLPDLAHPAGQVPWLKGRVSFVCPVCGSWSVARATVVDFAIVTLAAAVEQTLDDAATAAAARELDRVYGPADLLSPEPVPGMAQDPADPAWVEPPAGASGLLRAVALALTIEALLLLCVWWLL